MVAAEYQRGIRVFEPLYQQIVARYGTEQLVPILAELLPKLIARSSLLVPRDHERLGDALGDDHGEIARQLSEEWENAYLALSEEFDDAATLDPALDRAAERSRLAAAVAEFRNNDCREFRPFSFVLYELSAGLNWEEDDLIAAIHKELHLD